MSAPRGRRSRSSRSSPSERRKVTVSIKPSQRRFLRKLLYVLAEVVDEEGQFSNDFVDFDQEGEDSGLNINDEKHSCNRETDAHEKHSPAPLGDETTKLNETEAEIRMKQVSHFKELCKKHGQLNEHIRSLLSALGGGGRTARALDEMHKSVNKIATSFEIRDGRPILKNPLNCAVSLDSCYKSALEVQDGFKELGLYNTAFFDTLESIIKHSRAISVMLGAEYGHCYHCPVDENLVYMFGPLFKDFEDFVNPLTDVAEKQIAALRQSQDFLSQRYLNLTTIATFLSSVTATTLQISADDAGSLLTNATNTLWFVSLVFSTASAVYSLLVMTWRQSSVCKPDLALPSSLYFWFRNGPMYTLITALITFSVGLCLLAFRVGDQEGFWSSAVIPSTFAGTHAYAIFIFSSWFLFEKWKARHMAGWANLEDFLAMVCDTFDNMIKGRLWRISIQIRHSLISVREYIMNWRVISPHEGSDVESGREKQEESDIARNQDPSAATIPDASEITFPSPEASDLETSAQLVAETQPEDAMVIVKAAAETESIMGDQGVPTYKPLEKLLDISPRWNLLASARNDSVTIYRLPDTCSLFEPMKTPDGERVESISWHPRSFDGRSGLLLTRSRKSVSIWKIRYDRIEHRRARENLGHFNESVTFAHWTFEDDADTKGFICTVGSIIKFFNEKCEEIPGRSINVSKLRKVNRVIDAAFVRNYLLCLVEVDQELSQLFVLNVDQGNSFIQSTHRVSQGHTSMTVSLSSNRILLLGSKYGAQVAELSISESNEEPKEVIRHISSLRDLPWWDRLEQPEDAITFYGDEDKILVGYSKGEIVALHRKPDEDYMSALHIFTTPTGEAMPKKPVSFAVGRGQHIFPYMFAFADEDGRVIIWSVQSNTDLDECPSAEPFKVHDCWEGRYGRSTITSGKFLILPVNDGTETGGTDKTDETDETDVLEYVRYLFTSV